MLAMPKLRRMEFERPDRRILEAAEQFEFRLLNDTEGVLQDIDDLHRVNGRIIALPARRKIEVAVGTCSLPFERIGGRLLRSVLCLEAQFLNAEIGQAQTIDMGQAGSGSGDFSRSL